MINILEHEAEQNLKTSNNWKFILIYYFFYFVYRVSANAPLPTYMHHILVIITSYYDGPIK